MLYEKIKLEPDEELLKQTRRHWFVIVASIVQLVVLAFFPILIVILGLNLLGDTSFTLPDYNYGPITWFAACLWLLMIWISIFQVWTNYYLDLVAVTDRRAILINQKGFFRRSVTSFRLERLQDMNVEINGVLATLLDYGTLHAETAGHNEEEFRAYYLPQPRELKALIARAADNRITTTSNHAEPL